MECLEFVLITLINTFIFGAIIYSFYRFCAGYLWWLLLLLVYLSLEIKSIDLAILFAVYFIQEIVLQVSLCNKRSKQIGFACQIGKALKENSIPISKISIKDKKRLTLLFYFNRSTVGTKTCSCFRCLFSFFSFSPKK